MPKGGKPEPSGGCPFAAIAAVAAPALELPTSLGSVALLFTFADFDESPDRDGSRSMSPVVAAANGLAQPPTAAAIGSSATKSQTDPRRDRPLHMAMKSEPRTGPREEGANRRK